MENHSMEVHEIPSLDDLLRQRHPHFEFSKTLSEARDEPLFIV
jgi:hypothetical protein